jgi:hypothetical protein
MLKLVNVHVNELLPARIWQHTLCVTFSASVNINYRLPIKVYYHICTYKCIRIEIPVHGEVYSIQHYVINKTDGHDTTEIVLKVALNTL